MQPLTFSCKWKQEYTDYDCEGKTLILTLAILSLFPRISDLCSPWNENHILEFIFIYIVVLNKNLLVPTKFTGLGPENMCSSWGLLMIVRLSTLNQDETIMSPSPFVSHLWLWGGQLWIKMKRLCLPLPSSVTYDCEEVNFESRWNNYASLSLRQSPMIVRRSTLNPKETVQQVQPPLIARGSILKPRVTFLPFFIAVSST